MAALDFHGQTVWVTGAGKGIGYATALAFVEAGANVTGFDLAFEGERYPFATETLNVADAEQVREVCARLLNDLDRLDVLVNAAGAVSATVNLVVTASFALIISVYLSLGAQSLGHQARTLVRAYLKPGHAAWVLKFCRLFRQSFANFLTGQCSEAVILGMLMSLAFSLFRIPYGSLVGMLTAICAIIPYVGALLSCVISVFLVLLVDPLLAVRALLVYLAVQFIENQFIYPRVVGKSVGLSPLYTLVAAMIGGKLFGILGILFFIPLTAVVLELVKEDVCRRLRTKETLQ